MKSKPATHRSDLPWLIRLEAGYRLALCVAVGVVVLFAPAHSIPFSTRALLSWDAGSLLYLAMAWYVVARADPAITRLRVRMQDQSGYVIFLLVVTAACMSIVAIGFLVGNLRDLPFWPRAWHLTLSIVALTLSWLLIHTLFAFHYASRYYSHRRDPDAEPHGLQFPGGEAPDYLDFMYYAFVIGMTSQVSDVAVTKPHMRWLTFIHATLAFVFNIGILAMSINILGSVL